MLADIESIQWMAQSEAEFNLVCKQYKEHYLQQELSELERKLVTDFIGYFLAQWGPGSHAAQWYAGAHPFSLTNNQVIFWFPFHRKFTGISERKSSINSVQGLEGFHREEKANHTFRTELPLGQFIQMLEQLVKFSTLKKLEDLNLEKYHFSFFFSQLMNP